MSAAIGSCMALLWRRKRKMIAPAAVSRRMRLRTLLCWCRRRCCCHPPRCASQPAAPAGTLAPHPACQEVCQKDHSADCASSAGANVHSRDSIRTHCPTAGLQFDHPGWQLPVPSSRPHHRMLPRSRTKHPSRFTLQARRAAMEVAESPPSLSAGAGVIEHSAALCPSTPRTWSEISSTLRDTRLKV